MLGIFLQNFGDATKKRTNFLDMDDDSLFLIFDHFETAELLKISEIPQFVPANSMVLSQRFNKLAIVLKGADMWNFDRASGKYNFKKISVSDDSIVIERFSTAVEMLRNFGHVIKNLEIRPFLGWSEENVEQILELINLHCSETVKALQFFYLGEDISSKLTLPFQAVETVGLMSRSNNTKLISSEFGFNRLFPAIQYLYMDSYSVINLSYEDKMDYVMPHLRHIERKMGVMNEDLFNETQFRKIIKSNPQITSITLTDCNAKTLEFLSLHAPNLENLESFFYQHEDGDDYTKIRLNKLKKLKFHADVPRPFVCDNLEELTVDTSKAFADVLTFIANCVNLKRFLCNQSLDNGQILSLAAINMTVSEVKFHFDQSTEAEIIIRFLESSRTLEKLQLSMHIDAFVLRLGNELSKILPRLIDTWTIEVSEDIILSKKTN